MRSFVPSSFHATLRANFTLNRLKREAYSPRPDGRAVRVSRTHQAGTALFVIRRVRGVQPRYIKSLLHASAGAAFRPRRARRRAPFSQFFNRAVGGSKKIERDPQTTRQFLNTHPRLQDALSKVAARVTGDKRQMQCEFMAECIADILDGKDESRKATEGSIWRLGDILYNFAL
jgi:hypothetical protein